MTSDTRSTTAPDRHPAIPRPILWLASLGTTTILICALAFSFHRADPDLWGHVQYGRDALREGLPTTTTYSFTAEGYRWINHENLCELLFASVIDRFGVTAMLILKAACGMLVVALAAWHARTQQVRWPVIAGSSLLLASVLAHFWPVRPQFISYTLFTLIIALVTFAFAGWQDRWHLPWLRHFARADDSAIDRIRWRMKWLWLVPVIMCIWTNSHGAFMAGLAIYLAYLGLRGVEAYCVSGRDSFGMLRRLAVMAAVAVLATFLNPYGPRLHFWLLETLSIPWPEITEWQAISFTDPVMGPFVLLVVVALAGLIFSQRPLDATHLVLLALTLWQSCTHWRHLPFLAILVAFWLPMHWQSALQRWGVAAKRHLAHGFAQPVPRGTANRWQYALVAAINVSLAMVVVARWQHITVDRAYYPVSAVEFIHKNDLHGRLVVTFNWAQYALGVLASNPQGDATTLISFDGRLNTCYPQVIIDEHFDLVLGNHPDIKRFRGSDTPPPRPEAILERGDPELVLISRQQPHSVKVLHANGDRWTLLYQDSLAQVWGRRDLFDDPTSPRYFPLSARQLDGGEQKGHVSWPARPDALQPVSTRFVSFFSDTSDSTN